MRDTHFYINGTKIVQGLQPIPWVAYIDLLGT